MKSTATNERYNSHYMIRCHKMADARAYICAYLKKMIKYTHYFLIDNAIDI